MGLLGDGGDWDAAVGVAGDAVLESDDGFELRGTEDVLYVVEVVVFLPFHVDIDVGADLCGRGR